MKEEDGVSGCELHEGDGIFWLALAKVWAPLEIEADGAGRKAGEVQVCGVVVSEVVDGRVGGAGSPEVLWELAGCAQAAGGGLHEAGAERGGGGGEEEHQG